MQTQPNGALAVLSGPKALSPVQTASDLAAAFLAGYSASTRAAYACDLKHWGTFLGGIAVEPLAAHRTHVDVYVRMCESDGLSASTIARRLSTLAGFYAYAVAEDLIDRNPVQRVRRPKVSDESPRLGLDRDELARLLAVSTKNPRDHALVCLLALNGLRVSETLGLDVSDLSHERGHRTVALARKGGKRQTAPLAPMTSSALDALLGARSDGPVFQTATGRRLDRFAAAKIIRRLAQRAGIDKPLSPHSLRHTFVTQALDAGASLRDVQDAAGHADPRTTRRYDRGRHSLDRHPTYAVAANVG